MAIGTRLAKIAQAQISIYGSLVTVRHESPGPGTYNPATGKSTATIVSKDTKAIPKKVGAGEVNGTSIQANDKRLMVAALSLPFTPVPNDAVVIGGVAWNISHVDTESAQGVDIIHELLIRK